MLASGAAGVSPGEAGDVFRGEPEAGCGDVLLQVGEAAGPGDGEHHAGGCQQRGQRYLLDGRPVPGGGLLEPGRVDGIEAAAAGLTDEAAARRLGTSLRTYRRRVAELMAAFEAGSRFQAGVRAGELGLAH